MTFNAYLLVFAIAFMGCVLSIPIVTRVAVWFGAIDRPDQFRRIHKDETPRLGGLGLAVGLAISLIPIAVGGYLDTWPLMADWWAKQTSVIVAVLIVLGVGMLDDTYGMSPRLKLLGQATAVLALLAGGISIQSVDLLGMELPLSYPLDLAIFSRTLTLDLPSAAVTLLWFLGCMNVWNLIDGMDGLASGVGLLVSGTLMLVAISLGHLGAALMAAALAGALAGFLLYNWHPACIFLGDSGSLLLGLLIGVIGIQGSLKGTTAVSILLPLLAMGLPISDTAMAIFRRWVRNLPLSAADRRHVHHLLIGLGLNPRQAVGLLYCFTAFLCGVVLLGVAYRSEILALILGISGCLAFLVILYSRRDDLANLRSDLVARFTRGSQERQAAKITWDAIQRIELCGDPDQIMKLVEETAQALGCDSISLTCQRFGQTVLHRENTYWIDVEASGTPALSGPTASFRLSSGPEITLVISLHQASDAYLAADIAFRFLQRLSLATAERLGRLLEDAGKAEDDFDQPSTAENFPDHAKAIEMELAKPHHRDPNGLGTPIVALDSTSVSKSMASLWRWAWYGAGSINPLQRQFWFGNK